MRNGSGGLARACARAAAAVAVAAMPALAAAAHAGGDVTLKDSAGADAATSGNAYSPEQTCGGCHSGIWATATQGYHFQQGRTNALAEIQVSDTFAGNLAAGVPGLGTGAWWKLSDGMYGKW
jgi:hypothetical protein